MANTPPTVSARQLWDLLKDLVDRVALRRRAKSDSSNQQTVNNRQPFGVDLAGLPFCRGASGIAQPHHRKIGVVSLFPRQGKVHQSRGFLTVNTERSWQLLSARYHVCGTDILAFDEEARKGREVV